MRLCQRFDTTSSFYNRRFLCQYMLCFFIFSKKLVQCGYYFVIFTVNIHVAEI